MYIKQATDLLEGLLPGASDEAAKELNKDWIEKLCTFAIMWSLGSVLELEDRHKLQEQMLNLPVLPTPQIKVPSRALPCRCRTLRYSYLCTYEFSRCRPDFHATAMVIQ